MTIAITCIRKEEKRTFASESLGPLISNECLKQSKGALNSRERNFISSHGIDTGTARHIQWENLI